MPKFIDFHAKLPPMPPNALDELKSTIGKKDQFGTTALGAYFTADGQAYCLSEALGAYFTADGQAYCLSEAPNSDAVCKSHESKGLTLGKGDVHEVKNSIGV